MFNESYIIGIDKPTHTRLIQILRFKYTTIYYSKTSSKLMENSSKIVAAHVQHTKPLGWPNEGIESRMTKQPVRSIY